MRNMGARGLEEYLLGSQGVLELQEGLKIQTLR